MFYLDAMQKEKEVLALLSRLDLKNVHFTNDPPGTIILNVHLHYFRSCFNQSACGDNETSLSGDAKISVHLVASEGLEAYLPLADMVDISSEVQRISKRLSKMQTEYDALVARLNSPKVYNTISYHQKNRYLDLLFTLKSLLDCSFMPSC